MAKEIVGIDIASGALKVASLKNSGSVFNLIGLNKTPIPINCWDNDILQNTEELLEALKSALKTARPNAINTKNATIALPETTVFSGTFLVEDLPHNELKQALPFELAESFSINVEDYLFDFELASNNSHCKPIETKQTKGGKGEEASAEIPSNDNKITIFAVAAKKTLINSVIDFCDQARLEVLGIDIKPNAIIRSIIAQDDGLARLVLDLGAGTICASIAEGMQLRLTSTVPTGTRAIFGENLGEAVVSNTKLTPVYDEIVHLTKYFENRVCPGLKISEIILTGGGSIVPGITEAFQKQTGLPASIGNPFIKVSAHHFPAGPEVLCGFADAIGLAMRSEK